MDRPQTDNPDPDPASAALAADLRSLFANMIEGVAYCQAIFSSTGELVDWRYLDVNPAYAKITGLEDVKGKLVSEVVPGLRETNPENFKIYEEVERTGVPREFETHVPLLSRGQWLHIAVTRPSAGHFVALMTDITQRREAELALRDSESRYRMLVEQSPDGIFLADADGHYLSVNRAGADMLGYTPDEILDLSIPDVLVREELSRLPAFIARTDSAPTVRDEWRFQRKDGSTFVGELIGQRLPDGGLQGVVRDTTERRLAEDAIRDLNATLERRVDQRTAELSAANEELAAFSYAVSHDLRAPLRAMSGFSQALKEDCGEDLDEEALGYIARIQAGSQRMEGLIDGLLALSRATRGDMVRAAVDISSLAQSILEELAGDTPDRHVTWQVDPDVTAHGDPRMLDAVMRNLLGNAWKYTGKTVDADITVTSTIEEGERWICVTDNGAGFDPAYADKLFQPFQRLHRQDEFTGLGIGLATVKRIVDRHGGRILAVGTPGAGARVCFMLPPGPASDTG